MASPNAKRQLVRASVFLTPLLLILLLGLAFGGLRPHEVKGAIPLTDPDTWQVAPVERPEPTTAEIAALFHLKVLAARSFGDNPLYYREGRGGDGPGPITGPGEPSPPAVTLRAILQTRSGGIVLIDDESYRLGDSIDDTGWVITDIDVERRVITIEHPRATVPIDLAVR